MSDYLSGKPVANAEVVSSDDVSARSDKQGKVVLTLGSLNPEDLRVKVAAGGYRDENLTLTVPTDETPAEVRQVGLVSNRKEVFISKQTGNYDLYKIDIDGKNKQVLLAATGLENGGLQVVANRDGDEAALVSRRDNTHNQDGYPLQSLTLVDVKKGTTLTLDHSERIFIVDWLGDRLIYAKVKAGASAGNPDRYQLMSYDFKTTERLQLAAANYLTGVLSAKGKLYYAASNNYAGGVSFLGRINPDASDKKVILSGTDIWNISRVSSDTLSIKTMDSYYSYKFGDEKARKVVAPPPGAEEGHFFLDSPDGTQSVWVDTRDGKGVLLRSDAETGKDTVLATQFGLCPPLRWLNDNTIIYRVGIPGEIADYVVSLDGGAPRKIVDLTSTAGLGNWTFR